MIGGHRSLEDGIPLGNKSANSIISQPASSQVLPLQQRASTLIKTTRREEYANYHDIKKHLNYSLQIKDPALLQEFYQFNNSKQLISFVRYVAVIFLLIIGPMQTYVFRKECATSTSSDQYDGRIATSFLAMISAWLCALASFVLYVDQAKFRIPQYIRRFIDAEPQPSQAQNYNAEDEIAGLPESIRLGSWIMSKTSLLFHSNNTFSVCIQILFYCQFIRRSFNLNCIANPTVIQTYYGGGKCYEGMIMAYAMSNNILMMLCIPTVISLGFPNVHAGVIAFNITCSFFIMISVTFYKGFQVILPTSILFGLVFSFAALDMHIRNLLVFFANRRLRETLDEIHRMEEENRANEMRSMIGNIAHDLKTPLTSFQSGVSFMQDEIKSYWESISREIFQGKKMIEAEECTKLLKSLQSYLDTVHSTNAFMLMAINRCVDFTKASKGIHLTPTYESVSVNSLFDVPLECMSNVQSRIQIVLEEIPKEMCKYVITDKQWVRENILCLLSNAIKYQTAGKVIVRLHLNNPLQTSRNEKSKSQYGSSFILGNLNKKELKSNRVFAMDELEKSVAANDFRNQKNQQQQSLWMDDTESFLVIEVEDQGIGMSHAEMEQLFKPYKQHQRLSGGTGLGLYCLAKRVEALRGFYGVENRRDGKQGCLFWFAIPFRPDLLLAEQEIPFEIQQEKESLLVQECLNSESAEQTTENESNLMMRSDSNATSLYGIPKLDILVVDDAPIVLKMLTMMLENGGHRVSIAENGEIALRLVQERWRENREKFHLILMDLQMPVMDGIETTKRLRRFEEEELLRYTEVTTNCLGRAVKAETNMQLAIVGMSASSDYEVVKGAFDAGIDSFLAKPFQLLDFSDVVKYLMKKRRYLQNQPI